MLQDRAPTGGAKTSLRYSVPKDSSKRFHGVGVAGAPQADAAAARVGRTRAGRARDAHDKVLAGIC